jgi:hypothetical protein
MFRWLIREVEYGELFCYGINSIGTQLEPCLFVLEAAGERLLHRVNAHLIRILNNNMF